MSLREFVSTIKIDFLSFFYDLMNLRNKDSHYIYFFRLVQICSLLVMLYFISVYSSLGTNVIMYVDLYGIGLSYLTPSLLLILLSQVSLIMIPKGNFIGLAIGLIISIWHLFSWGFFGIETLIGLLGFYSLLNSDFLNKYHFILPPLLEKIVKLIKI